MIYFFYEIISHKIFGYLFGIAHALQATIHVTSIA